MDPELELEVFEGILHNMGALIDEECAENTPTRWLKMIQHYCQPYDCAADLAKAFEDPEELGDTYRHGMVVQTNIPYRALCAHHLAPVLGVAHVGYIPQKKVVGLSKLARVVYGVSHASPSLQEHVGAVTVKALMTHLKPLGAMAIIDAEHGCMACRGVEEHHVQTVTSHVAGVFQDQHETRTEFYDIVKMNARSK